ncbi:MAG: hypothetical protein RRC07_11385 [Anaerolineae bacterium]|nr:hypothetical protein [Anaerolineae bacterium]
MKPLTDKQRGWLYRSGERAALFLGGEEAPAVYLRYAFLLQGSEIPIFPALAVDDWGHERRDLSLYAWVHEEGERFPRSEIFGYERDGSETQVFLRALETFMKLPCFAYRRRSDPVGAGLQVQTVFVPDPLHMGKPGRVEVPGEIGWPLQHAAVRWRRARPGSLGDYGWRQLDW